VSCAKIAEAIELPFALWVLVGARYHLLDRGPYPSMGWEQFWGVGATPCKV